MCAEDFGKVYFSTQFLTSEMQYFTKIMEETHSLQSISSEIDITIFYGAPFSHFPCKVS